MGSTTSTSRKIRPQGRQLCLVPEPKKAPLSQVLLDENLASLPSKPNDPQGRYVAWILVTSEPGLHYQDQFIAVDAEWIDRQIQLNKAIQTVEPVGGYRVPLLQEHMRTGERVGDILELARVQIAGAETLIAAVAFNASLKAADKIADQSIKYFSPGFGPIQDSGSGEVYPLILQELSLASAPHQKGFGPTHVLAKEGPMKATEHKTHRDKPRATGTPSERAGKVHKRHRDKDGSEESATMDEVEEKKEEITIDEKKKVFDPSEVWERLDYLERKVEELARASMTQACSECGLPFAEGHQCAEEEEEHKEIKIEEERKLEASEISVLASQVAELTLERDAAQYRGFLPGNPAITLTEDLKGILFGVWRQDRETVSGVVKEALSTSGGLHLAEYTQEIGASGGVPQASDPQSIYKQTLAETGDAVRALQAYKKHMGY